MSRSLPLALILAAALSLPARAQTAPATTPALRGERPWIISPDVSNAAPLTADTLEKWLADKEIVEVVFAGPHLDRPTLPKTLQLPEGDRDSFQITPGETGGGSIVSVRFAVSPDTIKRILALQASFIPHNFRLDPARAAVITFRAIAANRQQARQQVPGLLATLSENLTKTLPGIQCQPVTSRNDSWQLNYIFPGTNVRGSISVYTIRVNQIQMAAVPALSVQLRAVGLLISHYSTNSVVDPSPQAAAINNLLRQALAPLIDLDQKSVVPPAQTTRAAVPPTLLRALAATRVSVSPATNAAPLTADTLETWLADKEIISLQFVGPHTTYGAMEKMLPPDVPNSFTYGTSEGADNERSAIRLYLKVDSDNVKKLLALQASLAPRGFHLDPAQAAVVTFQGDPANRQKARQLLPDVLTSLREKLPTLVPGIQCTPLADRPDSWGFDYSLPNTDIRGMIIAMPLSVEWLSLSHMIASPSFNLRALGLIIENRARSVPRPDSPPDEAIRQAFSEALAPLVDLDQKSFPTPPK